MVAGSLGENLATREEARGATICEEAKPRAGSKADKADSLEYREERSRESTCSIYMSKTEMEMSVEHLPSS